MKIVVIDSEYSNPTFEPTPKKNEDLCVGYEHAFMGIYNGSNYFHVPLSRTHDADFTRFFIKYLYEMNDDVIVISFFSIAELQFLNFEKCSDFIKDIRVIKISDKCYNLNIKLTNKKHIRFRDLQKITNAENLDSLLKSLGIKSSKDFLKEHNMKIQ